MNLEIVPVLTGFFGGVVLTLAIVYMRRVFEASRARAREEAQQAEELERYRRSQVFANIGTWDWHINTDTLHWSDEIYPMFGYKVGEVRPSYDLFIQNVHPDDVPKVQAEESACMSGDKRHDIEYRVVWSDGTIRWLRETGNVKFDDNGKPELFTGIIRDVTASKETSDRYRKLAHYDALTDLPNRELFRIRLDESMARARRHNDMVALVFMDLNKFKPVNDKHGHLVGDKVLVAVAQRLKKAIRRIDTVARVGGDEFVVILEDIKNEQEALSIVKKLRGLFGEPIMVDNNLHELGVSIGVSLFPVDAGDAEELIHIADMAMYRAKQSGENQYHFGSGFSLEAQEKILH